jgi:cytochrome c oxidase subunit 1
VAGGAVAFGMSLITVTATPRRGVLAFVGSTDYKSLGLRLFVMAFGFFGIAGILALVMRTELATPQLNIVSHMGYNELLTMHGSTMLYLFC